MRVFDHIQQENLDRREFQLALLASVAIFILATGLALLMYPAIFSHDYLLSGTTLRIMFFGFCALSVLLVGYVLDRHLTIRQLRRRLNEEQRRSIETRRQASADLLKTLPSRSHFQDRLPMEFRRAASAQRPLSLLVVTLKVSGGISDESEVTAALGDAAKAMVGKLRQDDSIYLFFPHIFGVILPGVDAANAQGVANRLTEGLSDAAGASKRFTSEIRIFNYPQHAATASELEQAVHSLLPKESAWTMLADTALP